MKIYLTLVMAILALIGALYVQKVRMDLVQEKLTVQEGLVASANAEVDALKADLERERRLMAAYQEIKQEIKYVDRVVTQEVIRYRDRVVDRCTLSPEWVYAHNLSVRPAGVRSAPSGIDGPAGGAARAVDDAAALEVVTGNNRTCVAMAAQLGALQEWALSLAPQQP